MATKKQSTMKTSGVKNAAVITDGCNPELEKTFVELDDESIGDRKWN